MYKWNLNGHAVHTERWNGWVIGLIGGSLGVLLVGVFWWLQSSARSKTPQLQPRDVSRLGQPPARSHIQLLSHPARQEQPR